MTAEGSSCKTCGNKLSPFEEMNVNHALQGQCVNCYTSPKETMRRQAGHDMSMSPFTSVQRIHQHLTGPMHEFTDEMVDRLIGGVVRPHGGDPYDQLTQTVWRNMHSVLHSEAIPRHARTGQEHPELSTATGEDPLEVFHDRRS